MPNVELWPGGPAVKMPDFRNPVVPGYGQAENQVDDDELFPGSGLRVSQILGDIATAPPPGNLIDPGGQMTDEQKQGLGETALMLGSAAVGEFAAIPAIITQATNPEMLAERGLHSASDVRDRVTENMMYQPRTQGGQQQAEALGKGAEAAANYLLPVREGYERWANETLGPKLGGSLYAATVAGANVLPLAAVTRPTRAAGAAFKNALRNPLGDDTVWHRGSRHPDIRLNPTTGLVHVSSDVMTANRFGDVKGYEVAEGRYFNPDDPSDLKRLQEAFSSDEALDDFARQYDELVGDRSWVGPEDDLGSVREYFDEGSEMGAYQVLESPAVLKWLKDNKYDGVMMREDDYGPMGLAVFNTNQLREYDPMTGQRTKLGDVFPDQRGAIGYHGTPHSRLDRVPKGSMTDDITDIFHSDNAFSGTGDQAFGYTPVGYFAESPDVADVYRDMTSGVYTVENLPVSVKTRNFVADNFDLDGGVTDSDIPLLREQAEKMAVSNQRVVRSSELQSTPPYYGADLREFKRQYAGKYWIVDKNGDGLTGPYNTPPKAEAAIKRDYLSDAEVDEVYSLSADDIYESQGHTLEVDFDDKALEGMLDWDAPLSEQSDSVRSAIQAMVDDVDMWNGAGAADVLQEMANDPNLMNMTGEEVYRALKDQLLDRGASETLHEYGIPGIRYLDADSRLVGKGTRNIVPFDTGIINWVKRDGDLIFEKSPSNELTALDDPGVLDRDVDFRDQNHLARNATDAAKREELMVDTQTMEKNFLEKQKNMEAATLDDYMADLEKRTNYSQHKDTPWIGIINKDGRTEFKSHADGVEADWHHSEALSAEGVDEWSSDSTLRFVREFDGAGNPKEALILGGNAVLDPRGAGKQQIEKLATELKKAGVPGDYELKGQQMYMNTPYEGRSMGTIDDWAKKPSNVPLSREAFFDTFDMHTDLRGRDAGTGAENALRISEEGFKSGGLNRVPVSMSDPSLKGMAGQYRPKPGDHVYLIPSAVKGKSPSGRPMVPEGWKPGGDDGGLMVQIREGEDLYDAYVRTVEGGASPEVKNAMTTRTVADDWVSKNEFTYEVFEDLSQAEKKWAIDKFGEDDALKMEYSRLKKTGNLYTSDEAPGWSSELGPGSKQRGSIGDPDESPEVNELAKRVGARSQADNQENQMRVSPVTKRTGRSTLRGAQRKAYPGVYQDPVQVAKYMEEYKVAPESPWLGRLFGVTRADLARAAEFPGTTQGVIPGAAQKPKGAASAEIIMKPANTRRLKEALEAAREHAPNLYEGMKGWYIMDPAYHRILELAGDETEAMRLYTQFNHLSGMASPSSDVVTELRRGTAANMLAEQGRFHEFHDLGGRPPEARRQMGHTDPDLLEFPGHAYHSTAQAPAMRNFLDTGQHTLKSPKVPMYIQAAEASDIGRQSDVLVGDAHWSRGVGLADSRNALKQGTDKSVTTSELQQLAPWWREEIAHQAGLEAVPAQAIQWGLYSDATGVQTVVGAPKLEILSELIAKTAKRLKISPEEARDRVLMGRAQAGYADPKVIATLIGAAGAAELLSAVGTEDAD